MMLPTLMVAAMLRVMDLLKVIDIVFVMAGSGPGHSSETINLNDYIAGLSDHGSAIALELLAILMICTLGLIRLRRPSW
jgi:multiple sugar transport system permease protein